MQEWTTRSRRELCSFGKWGRVETHEVVLPSGEVIPDWVWIETPNFINVVVEDKADGMWLVFRQIKYGTRPGETLAPVGGYIEADEDPLVAAKRELKEEMGYEADDADWIDLTPGGCVVDCNRGCGKGYCFLARRAIFTGRDLPSDDLEEMHLLRMSTADLKASLFAGRFRGLSWALTVSLALHHVAAVPN